MLVVENLSKSYVKKRVGGGSSVMAVRNVGFRIPTGETLCLVGESGSGKTTIGRCIIRLLEPDQGSVSLGGRSVTQADSKAMKRIRKQMQMIFQDPYSSLNPRMTVGQTISEALQVHGIATSPDSRLETHRLFEMVGLSSGVSDRYPHELSGGQRQRVGIARSLAVRPSLIICDEPVSALDVSVQAQILNLLRSLQADLTLTYLFIAHDLAVVRQMGGRVAVLLHGELVEVANATDLFERPLHPYTRLLLSSVPGAGPRAVSSERRALKAESACVFYDRCPLAEKRCGEQKPILESRDTGRLVRCHLV